MKDNKKTVTPYKKLGFTYLETAEIVVALNRLMANYHMHYHKLRSFHWNVEGTDFFELHQQFKVEYNEVKIQIDTIAERIRVFGIKPIHTLKKYSELSEIKETEKPMSSMAMVKEILNDFNILHHALLDVVNAALNTGDIVTEHMITEFLNRLEKRHWMFTAWSKMS